MSTTTSRGLSSAVELASGTLKLEGTAQVLTTTQAGALITLVQDYQSSSSIDTTSQVALNSSVKQIQEFKTTDQVRDIEAIGLTDQQVSELMQSMEVGAGVPDAASTPNTAGLSQAAPLGSPGDMPDEGG